jgi:hypothetical protein
VYIYALINSDAHILQSALGNSFVFCNMFFSHRERCAEHLSGATCDEGRPLDDVRRDLPWAQGLFCINGLSALSAHSVSGCFEPY